MKKLIFKCVSMVLIFVGISNYMMYLMTGKSPFAGMKLPSLSFDSASLGVATDSLKGLSPVGGKDTIYKWVDEHGVTQYTSEPPPETVAMTQLELDENTNVIQGLKMPEAEAPTNSQNAQNPPAQLALPDGNLYSPEKIKKVIDDAKNVQKLLNDRVKQQDDALNSL